MRRIPKLSEIEGGALKTKLAIFMVAILSLTEARAGCLGGSEIAADLKKVNVSIRVGLKGYGFPQQMLTNGTQADAQPCLTFAPNPFKIRRGVRVPLMIELIDKNGRGRDITSSPHLKFTVSALNLFHITDERVLVIEPDPMMDSQRINHGFTLGTIEVEYVSSDGKISFNGFAIQVTH
jgi:hypothetical protein